MREEDRIGSPPRPPLPKGPEMMRRGEGKQSALNPGPSPEYGRVEREAERKGMPSILDHSVLDRAGGFHPV